ncbi:MAG: TlpA family protein disulfide reductase [Melioribacteraceae bacterium]|nr:TlpA family protein disulfide reductase [Melioribacteraceae bacterium]
MKKYLILILLISSVFVKAQTFSDFDAKSIDGKEIKFSETYKSGLTLVTFWALWCEPCRTEIHIINKFYEKYHEKGLNVISINQDTPRSIAKVRSYVVSHDLNFPVIPDLKKELFQHFNGQSIPLTFLIDKSGNVVYKHIGYLPGDETELEGEIVKHLGAGN